MIKVTMTDISGRCRSAKALFTVVSRALNFERDRLGKPPIVADLAFPTCSPQEAAAGVYCAGLTSKPIRSFGDGCSIPVLDRALHRLTLDQPFGDKEVLRRHLQSGPLVRELIPRVPAHRSVADSIDRCKRRLKRP
jgi:hypothetical protein